MLETGCPYVSVLKQPSDHVQLLVVCVNQSSSHCLKVVLAALDIFRNLVVKAILAAEIYEEDIIYWWKGESTDLMFKRVHTVHPCVSFLKTVGKMRLKVHLN